MNTLKRYDQKGHLQRIRFSNKGASDSRPSTLPTCRLAKEAALRRGWGRRSK